MNYIVELKNIESCEYVENGITKTQFLVKTKLLPHYDFDKNITINGRNYLIQDVVFLDIIDSILLKCVEEE